MKIQSLSIVVPTKKCVNNCPFCVSKTHDNEYENLQKEPLFERDFKERLEYARDNGTNTIILTGTGEALQNKTFIEKFAKWNSEMTKPFYVIELQTTGVYLDDKTLKWLREDIGVKTISLSVSDLFDNKNNLDVIGVHKNLQFDLDEICEKIKSFGFNLRISLNVLDNINEHLLITDDVKDLDYMFIEDGASNYNFNKLKNRIKELGADQVTFRELWTSKNDTEIDNWINKNKVDYDFFISLNQYIKSNGSLINVLPFGSEQYSLDEISVVIDDDCMAENVKEELKYLILRENGKLYFKWDDKGSLIF